MIVSTNGCPNCGEVDADEQDNCLRCGTHTTGVYYVDDGLLHQRVQSEKELQERVVETYANADYVMAIAGYWIDRMPDTEKARLIDAIHRSVGKRFGR